MKKISRVKEQRTWSIKKRDLENLDFMYAHVHVYDIVRYCITYNVHTCPQFIESGHACIFNGKLGGTEAFV